MGITITKENLENIYKNYEAFKHKIKNIKSSPKRQKTSNINEILKENLIHDNKVKVNNIIKDDKNIIKEDEVPKEEEDINKYLFRRNSSIGLKNSKELEEEITLNDMNYYETVSMDDNISEKSDYLDISNEPLFNRTKRSSNCDNKIIKANKLRNSYLTKLIYNKILTFQSEPKITNLIFFDWDDTLMCTSYLAPTGIIEDEAQKKKR